MVKIEKMNGMDRKDAHLQMLLHLNEDFDDDLLFDAIEMLSEEEWLIPYLW